MKSTEELESAVARLHSAVRSELVERAQREAWEIVDRRTGECAQMSVYRTEAQALRALVDYWRRDRRGGRPDIHDKLPDLDVRRRRPETCTALHR